MDLYIVVIFNTATKEHGMQILKNFIADEDGIQVKMFRTEHDPEDQTRISVTDIDAGQVLALKVYPPQLKVKSYLDFNRFRKSFK